MYKEGLSRGLLPDQFWNMTFFEFRWYSQSFTADEELKWQHTSLLAAIMVNQNRGKGKAASPEDFNPYSTKKQIDPVEEHEKAKELAEFLRNSYKKDEQ